MDVDSPRPIEADLPSREEEDVVVSAPAAAVPQQAESSVQAQMQSESVTPTPAQPESTTQEQQSQIQSQTQTQSQTQSHPTTPPPRSSFTTPQPRSDAIEIDLDSPLPKPLTTTATTSNDASTSAAAEPVTANGTAANIDTPMPLANGHDEAEPREDTSSASSSHPASNGAQNEEDDMDRFLKRMEMEKVSPCNRPQCQVPVLVTRRCDRARHRRACTASHAARAQTRIRVLAHTEEAAYPLARIPCDDMAFCGLRSQRVAYCAHHKAHNFQSTS